MYEGCRFGPERNDSEKRHPDLVPYSLLPESEKEFDRKAVVEAIKQLSRWVRRSGSHPHLRKLCNARGASAVKRGQIGE
jgi:hypothetical protein